MRALPELQPVAHGLLEVVAEQLVQLDEAPRALRANPRTARAGRPGAPSAARRTRRRGSGGGGSGSRPRREPGPARARSAACEPAPARRGVTCGSSGTSAWTAPRWKISPSTAAHSSTARSALLEPVEAGRQERLQRRRDDHLAVAGHRQHLADEERVAAGRSRDPLAQRLVDAFPGSAARRPGPGSGSRRSEIGQVGRRSASSGRARQRSRSGEPEERSATCSTRSRNVSSPQWMSSKTTASGCAAAACSSVLRKAQAISSAEVAASASPEQRPNRRRRFGVGRQHVELLQHLDHRPVGDSLAVGQAPPAHDPSPRARRAPPRPAVSCPTPASPTIVTSSQRCSDRARSQAAANQRELPLAADEPRLVAALGRLEHPQQPVRANGVGLPLQLERRDGLDLDGLAHELERRLAEQHLARLCRLLEPCGDVDGVARRQALLGAGDDGARVQPDARLDSELGKRVAHLGGRPHRAQRVVLVRRGHAEDRHHRVADELLDRSLVALDDRLHALEVAREQAAKRLGIELLSQSRRARDVAEQDGDRLALHVLMIAEGDHFEERLATRVGVEAHVLSEVRVPIVAVVVARPHVEADIRAAGS